MSHPSFKLSERLDSQQLEHVERHSLARALEYHTGGLLRVEYFPEVAEEDHQPMFGVFLAEVCGGCASKIPAKQANIIGGLREALINVAGLYLDTADELEELEGEL